MWGRANHWHSETLLMERNAQGNQKLQQETAWLRKRQEIINREKVNSGSWMSGCLVSRCSVALESREATLAVIYVSWAVAAMQSFVSLLNIHQQSEPSTCQSFFKATFSLKLIGHMRWGRVPPNGPLEEQCDCPAYCFSWLFVPWYGGSTVTSFWSLSAPPWVCLPKLLTDRLENNNFSSLNRAYNSSMNLALFIV